MLTYAGDIPVENTIAFSGVNFTEVIQKWDATYMPSSFSLQLGRVKVLKITLRATLSQPLFFDW